MSIKVSSDLSFLPDMTRKNEEDAKKLFELFPIGASVEYLGISGVILEHVDTGGMDFSKCQAAPRYSAICDF